MKERTKEPNMLTFYGLHINLNLIGRATWCCSNNLKINSPLTMPYTTHDQISDNKNVNEKRNDTNKNNGIMLKN